MNVYKLNIELEMKTYSHKRMMTAISTTLCLIIPNVRNIGDELLDVTLMNVACYQRQQHMDIFVNVIQRLTVSSIAKCNGIFRLVFLKSMKSQFVLGS